MLTSVADTPTAELDVKEIIEHAKRAFALKNFEKAVDCYATALELTFVASILLFRGLDALLYILGQRNTVKTRPKLSTCTSYMGKLYWRMPSPRLQC